MRCDDLEALIEAIADGSYDLPPQDAAHVTSCAVCAARLEGARAIETFLRTRAVTSPSAAFTSSVMAQVGHERWKTERVIDLGFNLAMAAGVLVILSGAAGLAWSLGFLSITVDLKAVWTALDPGVTGRVLSEAQTVAMAAGLLTMALVLWWWVETAAD